MRIVKAITNCARCGGDHESITAIEMAQPFAPPEAGGLSWTHFAPCPTNGQPILFVFADHRPGAEQLPDPVNGTERFEEALEWCYWHFDALRKGDNAERKAAGLGPQEERDAFKATMREFYAKWRLAPGEAK